MAIKAKTRDILPRKYQEKNPLIHQSIKSQLGKPFWPVTIRHPGHILHLIPVPLITPKVKNLINYILI